MWNPPSGRVLTDPGADVLAPGIVWYAAEGVLAVYPSLLPIADRLVALAVETLGPHYLMRAVYRSFCRRRPREVSLCLTICTIVLNRKGRVPHGGEYWRVGASTSPAECSR